MSDQSEKTDGFGIGELGGVPEGRPEDVIETIRIEKRQAQAWHDHHERCRSNLGCETCGGEISARLYYSGTMGSRNFCESHWVLYWKQWHPEWPDTYDGIMGKLIEQAEAEEKRTKRCARCGSTNAAWNSGAGEDLCPSHWDEY